MSEQTQINRITMFKIPARQDQETLINIYKGMATKATRHGKPYILSVTAGFTIADQRNQGYTVAVVSKFASQDDMEYYDNDCEAHKELKAFAKGVHQGALMAFFTNAL